MQAGNQQGFIFVPAKWANETLGIHGERDVAAVANHVDEARIRHLRFDRPHVKQIVRSPNGPASDVLTGGDLAHNDSQKVGVASAMAQDLRANLSFLEPRSPMHLAA